jgi:hypothetical protein
MMALTKTIRRQLYYGFDLSSGDIDSFDNPKGESLLRILRRIRNEGYDRGYHKAIEDIKIIRLGHGKGD